MTSIEQDDISRAEWYRFEAGHCRDEAERTPFADVRDKYLELAASWDDMARQFESDDVETPSPSIQPL